MKINLTLLSSKMFFDPFFPSHKLFLYVQVPTDNIKAGDFCMIKLSTRDVNIFQTRKKWNNFKIYEWSMYLLETFLDILKILFKENTLNSL